MCLDLVFYDKVNKLSLGINFLLKDFPPFVNWIMFVIIFFHVKHNLLYPETLHFLFIFFDYSLVLGLRFKTGLKNTIQLYKTWIKKKHDNESIYLPSSFLYPSYC